MQKSRNNKIYPLVSIIIPVYNKVDFVQQTLDSTLGQTYPNTEIILIDDGSLDGSFEILNAFFEKFPNKITLIDQKNRGVSAATNMGIRAANGEYFQFLDADDLLSPNKIESQMQLLLDKPISFMSSCEWLMFQDNAAHFSNIPYGVFQDFDLGLNLLLRFWNYQEMMQPASYLVHRTLIEKAGLWDETLSINQDGEFFSRVLLQADAVLYESHGKVYYRNPGLTNVSQQKSEKAFTSLLESYQAYERNVNSVENSLRVRMALKKVYQKFIYDCFPNYPHLITKAEELMEALQVPEKTFIAGPRFQQLSRLIGFKNALRLKRYF